MTALMEGDVSGSHGRLSGIDNVLQDLVCVVEQRVVALDGDGGPGVEFKGEGGGVEDAEHGGLSTECS